MVTASVAVIEEGHATYATGEITLAQLHAHASKFDVLMGVHLREREGLRTETALEKLEATGIEIVKKNPPFYSTRYYQKELGYKIPSKAESTKETIREWLHDQGFTVSMAETPLHIRHLERMRHRTGYIVPRQEE